MTILLVDDDLSTVECIRTSIDWNALEIEQVCTAYSKKGALNILESSSIDIVLCDIEMPMGSGLELLEEVRKKGFDCDFIFLTCHDSFSFASTAISYKASSYVLKPFNPEKVTAELIKVIEHRKSVRSIYENSRYGEYWLKNKAGIERNFWKDVLAKKLPADTAAIVTEAAQRGITVNGGSPLLLVLFSLQYDTCPQRKAVPREQWAGEAIAFLTANPQCSLEESRVISWWYMDRLHVYYVHPSADSRFLDALKGLLKYCKGNLPAVTNGYAMTEISLDQLAWARQRLEKMDHNNVGNVGQLQFISEEDQISVSSNRIDVSQLRTILASGNKTRILTYLRTQLEALAPERSMTPAMLYTAQQKIIQEVYAYLLTRGIRLDLPSADDESYAVMSGASTSMYNMLKWLSFFISYALDAEAAAREKYTIAEQVKTYIDAHYSEKITQNEIAKAVYLTPGYLSKVFKKETGISLNQYLNDKRIACAKELLASSAIDINEVAARSGFGSSSYFITSFRKTTGETPKEYREHSAKKGKSS